jgi:hypothetical protein
MLYNNNKNSLAALAANFATHQDTVVYYFGNILKPHTF